MCAQGSELYRAIDASVVLIFFDISTDILSKRPQQMILNIANIPSVLSIPIIILRRVRLPLRKKLYLVGSLSLSAVMVVVAILQAATLTYMGVDAIDVVWEIYFQFVELTLAIMVVSVTAFRAFFVQRASRSQDSPRTPSNWSSNRYRQAFKKVWPSTSTESGRHDQYSSPTYTFQDMLGVQTVIESGDTVPLQMIPEGNDANALPIQGARSRIPTAAPNPPQVTRPRFEVQSGSSWEDPNMEYHRIQKLMDHRTVGAGPASDDVEALSPGTGGLAFAASTNVEAERCNHALETAPPIDHTVTPMTSSTESVTRDVYSQTATPSPISPLITQGPYSHIEQRPIAWPQTNIQRILSPYSEALQPGPELRLPPSNPPTSQAAEARARVAGSTPSPVDSASPTQRDPRVTHIATQHISQTIRSPTQPDQTPALAEPAIAIPRKKKRATADPEMRESGLKRAISASLAKAWNFSSQRSEEGESSAADDRGKQEEV